VPPVDASSGQALQNLLGSLVAGDLTAGQHERGGATLTVGQRVDLRQLPWAETRASSSRVSVAVTSCAPIEVQTFQAMMRGKSVPSGTCCWGVTLAERAT
jgi:hypothetical protein